MARNTVRDLTSGSPMKLLISFSLPLLGGFLFQQLYSFVDTAIVGRFLGYDALAAVGSTGSLNFLINGFCMGLCSGFAIPIAQAKGARADQELRLLIMHSVYLCAAISVLMALVTGFCSPLFLDLMNTRLELQSMAVSYIQPVFFAIPAMVLYNMCAGIMRSLGDSRTPMLAIVIAALLNIVLDLLFILVFHWKVAGAAWATIISQLVSGLWCLWVLMRKFPELKMSRDDLRIRKPFIRRLLSMGIPFGLQYSITAIGSVTVTIAVNGLGTAAIAAVTAAGKLSMLFCIVFDALASAMATFAGQNVGAKKLDRVTQGLKTESIVGCIYCVLAFLVILFFGKDMVALFVDADDPVIITDVLAKAHHFLIVNSAMYIPLLFVNIVRFTIQGVGFTTVAMTAGLMELIGRAFVAIILVPFFGFNAAVWANPAAWMLADAFLFPCLFTVMKWLRNRLMLTGQATQSPKEFSAAQKASV